MPCCLAPGCNTHARVRVRIDKWLNARCTRRCDLEHRIDASFRLSSVQDDLSNLRCSGFPCFATAERRCRVCRMFVFPCTIQRRRLDLRLHSRTRRCPATWVLCHDAQHMIVGSAYTFRFTIHSTGLMTISGMSSNPVVSRPR